MSRKPAYPTSIPDAAKKLDKLCPGWEKKINMVILDMRRGDSCILGQLYGDYNAAMNVFKGAMTQDVGDDMIFGYYASTDSWKAQIRYRLRNGQPVGFAQSLKPREPGQVDMNELYAVLKKAQKAGWKVNVTADTIQIIEA